MLYRVIRPAVARTSWRFTSLNLTASLCNLTSAANLAFDRSWQQAREDWCSCVSWMHFSPLHWYSPCRQINPKMGICILLKVDDFGSQQRSCGDWGTGICLLHFPCMHRGTPHCDDNQQWGIFGMHTVEDCNSPKWTWEDSKPCIFLLHVHRKHQEPPLCHRHCVRRLLGVLKFETCGVLQWDWRVCIWDIDAGLVEWRYPQKCLSLSTYCLLVQCIIPMSVALTQTMWQLSIYGMLQRIPSIANGDLHL
jgi:hypothetical protein